MRPKRSYPYQQGFRFVVAKNRVALWGESDLASSYAIYELLDRLGCRWFMPGELGEVIPRHPMVALAEEDSSLMAAGEASRVKTSPLSGRACGL